MILSIVLLLQLFATLFMVGLIWFVQIVHYPLMAAVGAERFTDYKRRHQTLTTYVVAPVMLLELASALALVVMAPPASRMIVVIGLALLIGIWLSTWLLQVPAHTALSARYSEAQLLRLVASNWIRTMAWSLRGVLVLSLTLQFLT